VSLEDQNGDGGQGKGGSRHPEGGAAQEERAEVTRLSIRSRFLAREARS